MEAVKDFIFLDSKIAAVGDCSHEIKRYLLLGRKAVANLDNVLKTKDVALLTKVHVVKAMVFSVVTYGCESWIIKKTEHWRIDAFELWFWRRHFRVPCKEIKPVNSKGNQPWIVVRSTNAEAEAPILWPPDEKSQLIGKDYWFLEFVFYLETIIMELLPVWNFYQFGTFPNYFGTLIEP